MHRRNSTELIELKPSREQPLERGSVGMSIVIIFASSIHGMFGFIKLFTDKAVSSLLKCGIDDPEIILRKTRHIPGVPEHTSDP